MIDASFLFAGKAIFTVSNPTGSRYTYRITGKDKRSGGRIYFAALLTGPNNETDYTYLGLLLPNGDVQLTGASRMTAESLPIKVLEWAARRVLRKRELPEGYEITHEGRCGRCARLLTVPESVKSGFGPECIMKIAA